MSGLLRNLSGQALGMGPAVRSAASLPFATPPRFGGSRSAVATAASVEAPVQASVARRETLAMHGAPPQHAASSVPTSRAAASPDASDAVRLSDRALEPVIPADIGTMHEDLHSAARGDRAPSEARDLRQALIDHTRSLAPLIAATPMPSPSAANILPASVNAVRDFTRDVHVTIGRIEVTAMHDRPVARRSVPDTRRPMSLDEYLARRRGTRS